MQVKLTIGERLKDLRTAQKLTLEQLAAEVGISKSALGKYESDNGKDISPYRDPQCEDVFIRNIRLSNTSTDSCQSLFDSGKF